MAYVSLTLLKQLTHTVSPRLMPTAFKPAMSCLTSFLIMLKDNHCDGSDASISSFEPSVQQNSRRKSACVPVYWERRLLPPKSR